MINRVYAERTLKKISLLPELYAPYMFRTVCMAEHVQFMETQEHLRRPPEYSCLSPIEEGTVWGKEYSGMWLRTSYTVPEELSGKILCAIPDCEAVEVLCFKNKVPSGIINSKNQFIGGQHSAMFLTTDAKAGETFDIAFECYAGHTCLGCAPYDQYTADEEEQRDYSHTYRGIRIVMMDTQIRDFIFDLITVQQMAMLPEENFVSKRAFECIMDAYPYMIQDVRSASEEELLESVRKVSQLLAPAMVKNGGERSRGKIGVMGHSHMDTAWLWPVSETVRKCARTYSQVMTLMDLYPEYTFVQSSALHLYWMKEYYPDIFEQIKKRVAEGRYEPNGGVWVECDCNVTGAEAMVRQFLYGQRFTKENFGYLSDAFWLPDTFGYNAAIPQIMQGFNVKYFYTQKLSWNDLNQFPADTFVWRGLDGSEVITHLNRMQVLPDVEKLTDCMNSLIGKHTADSILATYGFGDGGGGPTYAMLEMLRRNKDLEGLPVIRHTTASEFMKELEKDRDRLPLYDGELYLEKHRGTLTQMHHVKKNNRLAEKALHDMELFNVLAGEKISEKRDDFYRTLLKNQFHDILPGTCIPKVYEIALPEMADMIRGAKEETAKYAERLTVPAKEKISVYNQLSFARSDIVVLDGEYTFADHNAQSYTDFNGRRKTALSVNIPAMSALILAKGRGASSESPFRAHGRSLTTPFYQVLFDENGYIASLTDLQQEREICRVGGTPLGMLWMGEDMPHAYDNWEIDDDIFRKMKQITALQSSETVADGCVEYRIRNVYALSRKSLLTMDVVFYAHSRRIDYEVKVDWAERHQLLKAGFDVNIRASSMKNEIQFGYMERPVTRNNTWEEARFEVCNHKWSDLSETRYGVALLNDCKYGISCEGSDMRLTLHKGGCRPDPFTDIGVHEMTYSLLPHAGYFSAETVVYPAYELNYPPVIAEGEMKAPELFEIKAPGVICEALKSAEDVENAYVLRLYECEKNTAKCVLRFKDVKSVWITDMMEEKKERLSTDENGNAVLWFRPFEIKTILVEK